MPSALNDKRGAPRVSGVAAGAQRLMTEEDYFNNSLILVFARLSLKTGVFILSRQLRCHFAYAADAPSPSAEYVSPSQDDEIHTFSAIRLSKKLPHCF